MALAMAYKELPAGGTDDGGAALAPPVSDGGFRHVTNFNLKHLFELYLPTTVFFFKPAGDNAMMYR
jgi:hypothetical protein